MWTFCRVSSKIFPVWCGFLPSWENKLNSYGVVFCRFQQAVRNEGCGFLSPTEVFPISFSVNTAEKVVKIFYAVLIKRCFLTFGCVLTRQYEALLAMDNVELEIQPAALQEIAQKALDRQIGARGLRAIMESIMMKIMYQIPSDLTIKKVTITPECVLGGEPVILRDSKNPRVPAGANK